MLKNIILAFLLLKSPCSCYNGNSNRNNKNNNKLSIKQNNVEVYRKNLQKNIEIYESIRECNVTEITTCGEMCPRCLGKGVVMCDYCRGTGFLTMGDAIIGTGNNCTVCMGKGEKECPKCMGSGYIAKWRKSSTQ